ncbi:MULTISPECIES: malate:quinone oxidoreductase [Acetobacter]|uniref:Probable malate:quinone oxidoreductase n=1 Tax=Acetobacter thailandicus TaxID=1502842 RepID=A0ABT3QFT7_9PROT|nr:MULTISPECIES: malate:quinone oxidoreductase [Acetobacter]MBS0959599.1 malate:quinone oxidoreductase [Acetobacter thailandicus]MBS0979950.1 malate:quinone oxidoreductase [Acetobacter thailandicus]MBS1002730.1 malate:quinone oxidoreductase [Acetobacter thailandicus]MCX2564149.1 malate:quinone oxidoreductase [Acetobacter thailandicus]NHN95493.1 malate:quinone oxidoreductase [Acetobacter thailandicus]
MSSTPTSNVSSVDVALIGGGVMSATLGTLLTQLQPDWKISIFERLEDVAQESSDAWNNAGTGHSALCELNYTPQKPDGSVDISKAVGVNEAFQVSRQFWSFLVENGFIKNPEDFITPIPHMSFVWGEKNTEFLRKRYEALSQHPLFEGMEYSEDPAQMAEWMPLVMQNRKPGEKLAVTRSLNGTDVNFGALTHLLTKYLKESGHCTINTGHDVLDITRDPAGGWQLRVHNLTVNTQFTVKAKFVFIGCGGGALPLLQKTGIPESRGVGGFPVSGQFLRCKNPDIIARHGAKVYGKASVGAPPMSVPHLDTRMIDGKRALLFGPYAGFSTRFLKKGSLLDLPKSVKTGNILPMLAVARDNWDLTRYLIQQVMESNKERINALRDFIPDAQAEDWELVTAGQRVQIIKKDAAKGGVLQFGTEVISSQDGSVAALLGASPGASTAAPIMLSVLKKCFADKLPEWDAKLKEIVPSYGQKLADNPELCRKLREKTSEILKLNNPGRAEV